MPKIQWYPGHIAKYERQLKDLLKQVDVVVYILDARIPEATLNPRLEKQFANSNKPVLLLLNKTDLADPGQTEAWTKAFKERFGSVVSFEALQGKGKQQIIKSLQKLAEAKIQALMAKGFKRRPVRVLVAGMPNVGKSSVINSLVGKKKAKTGHRAGVTRQPQWVRVHTGVELLDIPGVIPPNLESDEAGFLLAVVNAVGDAAFDDEEAAQFLLDRIETVSIGTARRYYHVPEEEPLKLYTVALARQFKLPGGDPDEIRAAQAVLSDFRHGRLGALTLEPCKE
ncbi:MAG: ribosome biogenesis GTPase YlqF [Vampirovibrio sp.]|nr:ribosome biogenesis GTPase YlqF [Vampirovibrio sp.]